MPLLKAERVIEDVWVRVEDGENIPAASPVIISLERWLESAEKLRNHAGLIGVSLRNDQSPAQIAEDLNDIDLISLEFPKYTDGRAYSAARLLRDRYGFGGEVRATGNVLKDQYGFMRRCGFDAFEIEEGEDAANWIDAANRMTMHYQGAADDVSAVWAERHATRRDAVELFRQWSKRSGADQYGIG